MAWSPSATGAPLAPQLLLRLMLPMKRIAHLSDVHLIAPKSVRPLYGLRSRALRFGRTNDPSLRAKKLATALQAVAASGADHLVVSGDLTELGDDAEFELFAGVLADAGLAPDDVTLVPGNHDAYTSATGWTRALEGPLAEWSETSARPGEVRVVDRGAVAFIPVDVSRYQSVVWSGGELTERAARELDVLLSDPALATKAVVLVLHHPPFSKHDSAVYRFVDSLRGSELVNALLDRHPHLHLLHGHFHRIIDRPRVFGAPGVADDEDRPRVRVYDVRDGRLESAGLLSG